MQTTKKAAVGFIFITLLIDIIGIGIIIPVLPKLLQELGSVGVSEASKIGGWLAFAYAFTQFVFAPLVGGLSDRFGRRPIVLISLAAFTIDYLILASANSIFWLFIGRILAGLTGASVSTAMAYIADVSTPKDRAKNFGLVGAAFGLGFIIGPLIGGVLGVYGARVPFYAAAFLCFVNFIYGYFLLPESLPKDKRRTLEWKSMNPVGALLRLKRYPIVIPLVTAMFFMYFASHAINGNWSFYTIYRYDWDERMIGISLGFVGILIGLVQGILVRFVNPKLGNSKSILIGFALNAIGQFLIAFASQEWMIFLFVIPYCLGGIAGPAVQSEITGHIPPNEQGQIQSTLASVNSATATFGPVVMTTLFYWFTKEDTRFDFPGAPFVLATILVCIAWGYAYKGLKQVKEL
ncbi:TCR/Tet family MFS transporter [Capnocytophaga sp. ARDL2]|uniref:TCR/Tet family MFS transporter n=1 Tax=Capnocytophaga sp. ARDL2 TaxID=3238809 RepID=UPI0035567E3A